MDPELHPAKPSQREVGYVGRDLAVDSGDRPLGSGDEDLGAVGSDGEDLAAGEGVAAGVVDHLGVRPQMVAVRRAQEVDGEAAGEDMRSEDGAGGEGEGVVGGGGGGAWPAGGGGRGGWGVGGGAPVMGRGVPGACAATQCAVPAPRLSAMRW
jgi:hypothetical protein